MGAQQKFLDAAKAATGLDDFGDDSFREGLEILVRSLNEDAHLNAVGEKMLFGRIVIHLQQRLQIEDWYKRHPEIEDVEIKAPLIGISLPRTGSTALSFLLNEDPHARSLRRWESSDPCPPPSTVKGLDPRLVQAEAIDRQAKANPKASHLPQSATGPVECVEMMALDFKSFLFQALAHTPTYSDWLMDANLTTTYLYERRVLKLLQWGCPDKPWRLKCPNHLTHLDHLNNAFPDARYVMTHRDPTEVINSSAHLYADYIGRGTDKVDLHYIGEMLVSQLTTSMDRALAFRDHGNEARFYDIHFRAMQRDPIGEVRGLYEWLGEPVTAEFEAGMSQWWQSNAQNREANVHPDPSTYGLDLDKVRPMFADYTSRISAWTTR
jgi:Sulfotransferase family